jgi:hypothetical protein
MDSSTLTALFEQIQAEAPAIATRELLEAAAGRKCSRVELGAAGLDRLADLSRAFGFGLSVGRQKVIVVPQPHKGDWADGTVEFVPTEDPRGYFAAYLGPTEQAAEMARDAEEFLGDDAFGELLGIPACCRAFYRHYREVALATGDDYLPWTLSASGPGPHPAGANICAQYFDSALLGYYPCSLSCISTRERSARTLTWLQKVAPALAVTMETGHRSSYIVVPGVGMARLQSDEVEAVLGALSCAVAAELWSSRSADIDAFVIEISDGW